MNPEPRRALDQGTVGLAVLISLFLMLVCVSTREGTSLYFLALGAMGTVGFGMIAVHLARRRSLTR